MKKKMILVVTALVLFMIPLLGLPVSAAAKDVTDKAAGDKDLKKICRMMTAYTTAMLMTDTCGTPGNVVELSDANCLSIAAFVKYNYQESFDYTAKELKQETKALFGKKCATKEIGAASSGAMLVCTADAAYTAKPYMYCGGEFGDTLPKCKIEKVEKDGKDYTVTVQNRIGYYGEKGSEKIGTTVIALRRSASSKYGYVVKGLTY